MKKKLLIVTLCLTLCICLFGLFGCGEHTHSYTDVVTPPTCTEKGYTTHTCKCGDKKVDTYVDVLNHNFTNGSCSMCNGSDGLEYKLTEDEKGYIVTSKGSFNGGSLVIPKFYNKLPVLEIGDGAFSYCTSLTSIVIPDSVTSIGSEAFFSCESLTSIIIGDSVTSIGADAFEYCTSLIYNVKEGIKYLGNADNPYLYLAGVVDKSITNAVIDSNCRFIGYYAFSSCISLTSVVIPNSVEVLGEYAFYFCISLTSVEIPNSVISIGNYAFYWCTSLTTVVIPSSVTSIGKYAFSTCDSLIYNIKDGIKYLGNSDNPYIYLAGVVDKSITNVVIDSNCRFIGGSAFAGCYRLVEVYNLSSLNIEKGSSSNGYVGYYALDVYTSKDEPSKLTYEDGYVIHTNGETKTLVAYFGDETDLVIPQDITAINKYAFYNCTSLTSVVIPNSVEVLGDYAFYICSSLTSVVIGDSVTSIGDYAFANCSSLTSIEIGDSVTSIGEYAFQYCRSLTSVVIGDSVTSIGHSAFYNCDSLTSVVIGDSVTSIDLYAFYECSSLTNIEISNSVESIGEWAFCSCDSLTSIEIPNSVTSIGEGAFYNCSSLTSVVIPNSVTSIGYYAFEYCTSLTSVVIGDSVTSIGDSAFYNCYKLVEVINKSSHITIGKRSPSNGCVGYYALVVYNSGDTFTGTKLSNDNGYIIYTEGNEKILVDYNGTETELVLPTYITKINQYAFYNCSSLTSVVIGDSVTSIGNDAFEDCTSLTSVEIGNSVDSIGEYAFKNCSSLTSVVIGDSVTSIGYLAFEECTSLTSVVIPDSVTSIDFDAFYNCSKLTSITFNGTMEEWNAIEKESDWNYSIPATYVQCNDGKVILV